MTFDETSEESSSPLKTKDLSAVLIVKSFKDANELFGAACNLIKIRKLRSLKAYRDSEANVADYV